MYRNNNCGNFFAGLIIGGLVGVGIALLYAPQSGDETRKLLKKKALEAKKKALEFKEEAAERFEEAKKEAKTKVEDFRRRAKRAAKEFKKEA
jgi:gas vesicle protein